MPEYFVIHENPLLTFIRESVNIIVGILFFVLIFKLIYFVFSYAIVTLKELISKIFNVVNGNKNNGNLKGRANRPNLYKKEIKEEKEPKINDFEKPTISDIQKINKPILKKEYQGLTLEEIKEKMNKPY